MRTPLLSVIVPVYNIEDYIEKCLDSIRNQTYSDIEIIVVDDGSTDNSGDLCDQMARDDNRITVYHKQNGGLVSARKYGLSKANGDYIANVDGDDFIDEDMFADLITVAIKNDCDIVQGGMYHEDIDGGLVLEEGLFPEFLCDYSDSIISSETHISNWLLDRECSKDYSDIGYVGSQMYTKVFKREIALEYNNVPDDMSFGEDFVAHLYFIKAANRIASINKRYYHYIYRNGSITQQNDMVYKIKNESTFVYKVLPIIRQVYPAISDNTITDWLKIRQKIIYDMSSSLYANKATEKDGSVLNCGKKYTRTWYYNNIEKLLGTTVALYGAGAVGRDYYNQLCEYEGLEVVVWVDKCPDKYGYDFYDVRGRDELKTSTYDFVLVAIAKEELADVIIKELVDLGIDKTKILWSKPERC